MDYSKQIFSLLGVKPYEEFNLSDEAPAYSLFFFDDKMRLKERTAQGREHFAHNVFPYILNGTHKIIKLPKKIIPTREEQLAIDYAKACGGKWLAMDKDGRIYTYGTKPFKAGDCWRDYWWDIRINIPISFLSWEDDEPYYIGDKEDADKT